LAKARKDGAPMFGYIETQMHGDVTWHDVDTVVVGDGDNGEGDLDDLVAKLVKFARDNNLGFKVVRKSEMDTPTTEPIPLSSIGQSGSSSPVRPSSLTGDGLSTVLGARSQPLVATPGTKAYSGFIEEIDNHFARQPNDGQGDCLFHAFSQGMEGLGRPTTAMQARQGAVIGMTAQEQLDPNFFVGLNTQTYFPRMRQQGQWGGEYEIAGLARHYGVHVRLHQPDGNGGVTVTDYNRDAPPRQGQVNQDVIDIVWVNRNHYEQLVPRG
jgi:hypothetical protein